MPGVCTKARSILRNVRRWWMTLIVILIVVWWWISAVPIAGPVVIEAVRHGLLTAIYLAIGKVMVMLYENVKASLA